MHPSLPFPLLSTILSSLLIYSYPLLQEGWFGGETMGRDKFRKLSELDPCVIELYKLSACINSTAIIVEDENKLRGVVGNKTEGALLMLAEGE
jgi:hypothetical protein